MLNAYGRGPDGLRARFTGGGSGFYYNYTFDPLGNFASRQTSAAAAGDRTGIDEAEFDAYGMKTGDYSVSTGASTGGDGIVGYGGEWGNDTDYETGLLSLGHRYYDPGTGHFLTRDPIDYRGGENLYDYAGNNPVNEMDPGGDEPAGSYTSFGDYLSEVGDAFKGYGDILNPVQTYRSLKGLAAIAACQGFETAGKMLVQGTIHGLTDWTTTSDLREFGRSFLTTELTVSPVLKKLPNITPLKLEGPFITPDGPYFDSQGFTKTGATLIKVSWRNQQKFRVDFGKLDNTPTMSSGLIGKYRIHFHRRGPGGIGKQWPYDEATRVRNWPDFLLR